MQGCGALRSGTLPAAAPSRPRNQRPVPARAAIAEPVTLSNNGTTSAAPSKPLKRDGPTVINGQLLRCITNDQLELITSLAPYIDNQVLPILKDTQTIWQPADFLPDPSSDTFLDEVRELRERTANLPDDYFVVLVGDMITEEALPTYMAMLNTMDVVRDETGASDTPWGRWTRQWTAEENRHGDLMNKYCYLSGRVNMQAVERTIMNLIGSGMDPKTENHPYLGFIYTSFQERATKISHGNTAAHAIQYGDKQLGRICAAIAGDEARHEKAYIKIIDEVFRLDPSGGVIAFTDMMKKQIVMPAHYMDDGEHQGKTGRNLFKDFSSVAQSTGTYTGQDYVSIMEFLIKHWKIASLQGLSVEAQKAQEDVLSLLTRYKRLTERQANLNKKKKTIGSPFSWIFNNEIPVLP